MRPVSSGSLCQRTLGQHAYLLCKTNESPNLRELDNDLAMKIFLSCYLSRRTLELVWHIKVDMLTNLSKHVLLDTCELNSQRIDRIAEIGHKLSSLLAIKLRRILCLMTCPLVVLLQSDSFLVGHPQAQDLPIFFFKKLLLLAEIFFQFFKCHLSCIDNILCTRKLFVIARSVGRAVLTKGRVWARVSVGRVKVVRLRVYILVIRCRGRWSLVVILTESLVIAKAHRFRSTGCTDVITANEILLELTLNLMV